MGIETNDGENSNLAGMQNDGTDDAGEKFSPNWASDAPRGGRAVLTRILKESAVNQHANGTPNRRAKGTPLIGCFADDQGSP